jgi:hypothetical protein
VSTRQSDDFRTRIGPEPVGVYPTEQSITCVAYVVYLVASRIGNSIVHDLELTS